MVIHKRTSIYAIGSGKGGVGKSTVAVNFAIAMAKKGFTVGLLDADIFGPSIPIMMGLRRLSPQIVKNAEGKEEIIPFTKFGIQVMSVGFFIEEAKPVIWRGPILHGTLKKMIEDVLWGELDYLFIDLPPGTGDTLLSLSQLLTIKGGLVVCTPQQVAALDALKAINAFFQLDIPLLGVVENMAGFLAPETGQLYHIFGEGQAKKLADSFNVPLLASIPLVTEIRQGADNGEPIAFFGSNPHARQPFEFLAAEFIERYVDPIRNPFNSDSQGLQLQPELSL